MANKNVVLGGPKFCAILVVETEVNLKSGERKCTLKPVHEKADAKLGKFRKIMNIHVLCIRRRRNKHNNKSTLLVSAR